MHEPSLTVGGPHIVQYWHTEEIPSHLDETLAGFGKHNVNLRHRVFNESSAAELIEEHFGARELAAFRSCAVPAMQSDYFRYCAVLALGGVYSDVDFGCTAPFDPLLDEAEGRLFKHPAGIVANSFFAFRSPGHPFLRLALDVATANVEGGVGESAESATGPMIFTGLLLLHRAGSVDAFLQVCGSAANQWQPKLMSEVVGSYDRVAEAFQRVRVDPMMELVRRYISIREVDHAKRSIGSRHRRASTPTPAATSSLPIIQYWHADEPPSPLAELFEATRRHNPGSRHLVFNESSAAGLIEEHFGARELAAFRSCAVPAMQSDYFRYCAVLALGGVYSDVDFGCTAPFGTLLGDAEGMLFKRPAVGWAINGFFAFRSPGHPFLRLVLDVATANIENRAEKGIALVTGPMIFARLFALLRLGSIDAFLQACPGAADLWQPSPASEVLDSYDRVVDAFEGIRVDPMSRLAEYTSMGDMGLPKEEHWTRWKSSIYR